MGKQALTARHVGVVACCCLQCCVSVAMIISAAGVFYPVIARDLGVQTAEVSAWMSVAMLSSALFSPVVGNFLGRVRLKTLRVSAVVVAGGAMALFSQASAPWMLWLAGACVGYALVLLTALGPATLVSRWFEERVGTVMGLYAAFTGVGGVLFLMLGQTVIDVAGWRVAYLTFAAISWVIGLPAELLLNRERPQECGLRPYGACAAAMVAAGESAAGKPEGMGCGQAATGEKPNRGSQAAGGGGGVGAVPNAGDASAAIREANGQMRTAPFALLVVCGFLMNTVCQINGYFPKYVMWLDGEAAMGLVAGAFVTGAALAAVCQAGNAFGKIGLGLFTDFSVRNATVVLAACGAAGIAGIWLAPATPLLPAGGLAFGFFIAGVLVLMPMLCREIFGSGEAYPVLYARVAVAPTLGGAVGNVVWPYLADNLGGFDAVFGGALLLVALVLASALAALALSRRT